ncbi:MAG: hypothetical protein GKS05_01735 [Nitrospirales bacterium]|nr:hypothetical protein [Nitrospirales bacterium]
MMIIQLLRMMALGLLMFLGLLFSLATAQMIPPHTLHSEQTSVLPQEPDEFDPQEIKAYYDWRNDMFFRLFDITGSGTVNYMTARRTYKVWLDDFGTPVVITNADPLFYWIDRNGNGEFEQDQGEMWSDPLEDGVTGNERLYDSSDLQTPSTHMPLWSAPQPS